MLTRLVVGAVLLGAPLAFAAPAPRTYVVQWSSARATAEQDTLVQQLDRALKDELTRRGAAVVERHRAGVIVLSTRVEVLPRGLKLEVLGLRGADRSVLGTITTKVTGASRAAQVRAVVQRVCSEAALLE